MILGVTRPKPVIAVPEDKLITQRLQSEQWCSGSMAAVHGT
jgi:hypothetical protein